MEVSALTHKSMPGLSGPSALLRLQSDERLIAMTRRGQHAAFEVLFSRYQSRLLAFCRHMLSSREDAEDVLQEVFTAAFNAVLADERDINVRPWLYRIARNRSLNHLRRASAIGVDSMDVHYADNGLSTGERVLRRESFRQLLGDVKDLPETQRTALLLREIDALSYEQIAHAMETTVPSVKSLLVRARISLAEAAQARQLSCEEVRLALGEAAEGLTKLGAPARRHVRGCERCRSFKKQLRDNNHALAAIFPVGPLLLAKKLLLTKLGSTASAGHVGAGAGAAGATASAAGASGAGVSGGLLTAGASAVATKAAAGLAAAAIVTAVATQHVGLVAHHHRAATAATAYVPAAHPSEPVVVHATVQPVSSERRFAADDTATRRAAAHHLAKPPKLASTGAAALVHTPASSTPAVPAVNAVTPPKPVPPPQVTEVTTQTTALPTQATAPTTATTTPSTPVATTDSTTGGTPAAPSETSAPAAETPPPAGPAPEQPAQPGPEAQQTTEAQHMTETQNTTPPGGGTTPESPAPETPASPATP